MLGGQTDVDTDLFSTLWSFGSRHIIFTLLCSLAVILVGCAQPPTNETIKKVEIQSDFSSGVDVAVTHHAQPDGSIVVADISNLRRQSIRAWFVHLQRTDGQMVSRSIRYYEGDKQKHREVFEVPKLTDENLSESFYVELYDWTGKLLIKSKPITHRLNTGQGG